MAPRRHSGLGGLLDNKAAKLLSLVLALVAWYAIKDVISFEGEITDVPIEIQVTKGWAILDRSENSVVVTFRGEREAVLNLDREQVKLVVDLAGKEKLGSMFVDLLPQNVAAPSKVRAVGVEPATLYLSLDQEGQRAVAVKASIQGQLPGGYELASAVCRPESVQLFGPRLKLDEIVEVKTAPIDLEGRLGSFKLRVPIAAQSESWVARVEPPYVQVEVSIVERSATREFTEVPVKTLFAGRGRPVVTLSDTNATVVVEGRSEALEALARPSIQAYVDCTGLPPGTTNLVPLRVHLPGGVTARQVSPTEVTVTVAEAEEMTDAQ